MNEFLADVWSRLGPDTNGDRQFTVSDIGGWAVEVIAFPGNAVLFLLLEYTPRIAGFFELGSDDYGGTFTIVAGILLWFGTIFLLGALANAVGNFDRMLTSYVASRYRDGLRRLRVVRRRLLVLVTQLTSRKKADGLLVETMSLNQVERAVLRCLTNIDDGAVLTIGDVAEKLNCPARKLRPVVQRLVDLDMVEPGSDSFTKRRGHRITSNGQMFLLGT